ncbi:MAG: nitroreductase family deazaflavin-dependent oxidoreductase [Dermatophilaceae bacterium]
MPLPRAVAKANRFTVNPVARLVAGRAPGFAVVRHRGRRSGREYATPINVFRVPSGFMTALTYGPDTDWMRNLTARGGGTLLHRGREIPVGAPIRVPTDEGMAAMPRPIRRILRAIDVTAFARWETVDLHSS